MAPEIEHSKKATSAVKLLASLDEGKVRLPKQRKGISIVDKNRTRSPLLEAWTDQDSIFHHVKAGSRNRGKTGSRLRSKSRLKSAQKEVSRKRLTGSSKSRSATAQDKPIQSKDILLYYPV